ncbi:hypothetical protein Tsp_06845 [Trichinella spiralis]|uniref:hypothetical protein n=1 Tax=Trichinella spiralis TaxID=6334 RepID=UPI0001EFC9D2|nr:hypothetical protein Tsp_06845 [Trichinella spiralis]
MTSKRKAFSNNNNKKKKKKKKKKELEKRDGFLAWLLACFTACKWRPTSARSTPLNAGAVHSDCLFRNHRPTGEIEHTNKNKREKANARNVNVSHFFTHTHTPLYFSLLPTLSLSQAEFSCLNLHCSALQIHKSLFKQRHKAAHFNAQLARHTVTTPQL